MNDYTLQTANKQSAINNKRDSVLEKAELYAHAVYQVARKLPRDELFGLTSQLKRSALSVPLNIVEGYARQSPKSEAQFLTIAYGSLKESLFAIKFAVDEKYITHEDANSVNLLGNEVGRLIWTKAQTLRKQSR